ncbi:MAG: ATPase, T2SS/T4P/T4SS family [bacterium]
MAARKAQSGGKFSDVLIARKLIDNAAMHKAEEDAISSGTPLEVYLVDKQLVSEANVALAVSDYLQMRPISLAHFTPDAEMLATIPGEAMTKHQAIPLARTAKTLTVAMGDPFDIVAVETLHMVTGLEITPLVALKSEIQKILTKLKVDGAKGLDMEDIMKSAEDELQVGSREEQDAVSADAMKDGAEEGPVIRMVNTILLESVRLRANDIHIEPQEDYVRLRYRVDGVLIERPNLPKALQNAIISRVKIMADLDIGEHRIPQDGRFRIKALGKAIDVRVSVLPTIFGGRVVMRTLDKSGLFPNLAALGLNKQAHDALSYAIEQPHGIILVSGPTGSGKTTTLYSCLQELNKLDVNLVTCEDPVEYQIPGIIQVKISPDVGCTFAAALRAILRQDPDIILIGEIRDGETAEIAIKAALTGHLVLSTLHANDAASTITRLLDMGTEPFLLASSVILAQAQRLYRRLCPVCKKEIELPLAFLKDNGVNPTIFEGRKVFGPVGCPKCNNTGFKGRASIMEVLPIDEEVRSAIIRQDVADDIRDQAEQRGMVTLRKAGLQKVADGDTSIETIVKVTGGGG